MGCSLFNKRRPPRTLDQITADERLADHHRRQRQQLLRFLVALVVILAVVFATAGWLVDLTLFRGSPFR